MGPYCAYCVRRCFVLRVIPDGPALGEYLLLATCARGMAHDQEATGHTHATAVNPYTDPEGAARIAARRAAEDEPHHHDGGCTWAGCGPWDVETVTSTRTVPWWVRGALRSQQILAAQREPGYDGPDTLRELREPE
jgi:hypothetical protein